jgi:hypothetical protein
MRPAQCATGDIRISALGGAIRRRVIHSWVDAAKDYFAAVSNAFAAFVISAATAFGCDT